MDMKSITEFIQNLGFPIAVVCYLLYADAREREAHKQEVDKLTTTLQNNTLAINTLTEFIRNHFPEKKNNASN